MAQGRADSRQQFLRTEGLCYVIIGSLVKSLNFFRLLGSGRDYNDRNRRETTHTLKNLTAINIRQSQIQKNQVRMVGGAQRKSRHSVHGAQGLVAI